MRKVILARIDGRLIHGQVVTSWLHVTNANLIYCVDDALPKDALLQRILKATTPPGCGLKCFDTTGAIEAIKQEPEPNERLMVITKNPMPYEAFVDAGIELERVVIGSMGAEPGRKKYERTLAATDEEIACFKRIIEKGVPVELQSLPDQAPISFDRIVK